MTKAARGASALALVAACAAAGCGTESPDTRDAAAADDAEGRVGVLLDRAMDEIRAEADSVDSLLRPVALLRPGEEAALRSYLNASHLERARSLGARPEGETGESGLEALVAEGRLVALADTTDRWVLRELDHSLPYVTPDTRALLERVGARFQERLDSLGLPPYRFEISSALRTAEQQADLRGGNVNATAGRSAHEYGTTVDIAYNGFAAPAEPLVTPDLGGAPWLERRVRRVADGVAELVAARRSRELQAILGRALVAMQAEGLVYVTLERQQPVYHITVAERLADAEPGAP